MNLEFGDIIARMEQAVGRVLTECLLWLVYCALVAGVLTFIADLVTTLIESPSVGRRALGWLLSSILGGVLFFGATKIATRRLLRRIEEAQKATLGYAAQAQAATSAAVAEQAKCREFHATCLEWEDKIEEYRDQIEAARSMEQNQP